jgi:hypothetical protein
LLPRVLEMPIALLLFLSGILACLAGYRVFKVVMAIYGFVLGAAIANTALGITNTVGMIVGAIFGGIAGAVILVLAYFVGIALMGASLGAVVAHVGWNYFRMTDPPLPGLVVIVVLGAMGALILQRYVLIVATAFSGAWIAILSGLSIAGNASVLNALAGGDISALSPPTPGAGNDWVPTGWLILGLVGTVVQLGITGRSPRR